MNDSVRLVFQPIHLADCRQNLLGGHYQTHQPYGSGNMHDVFAQSRVRFRCKHASDQDQGDDGRYKCRPTFSKSQWLARFGRTLDVRPIGRGQGNGTCSFDSFVIDESNLCFYWIDCFECTEFAGFGILHKCRQGISSR